MPLFKKLKTLDTKFSWSFFGFLIGIIGVSYAIYVDQFKEENQNWFMIFYQTQEFFL